jgi:hypothetical protein
MVIAGRATRLASSFCVTKGRMAEFTVGPAPPLNGAKQQIDSKSICVVV